VVKVDGMEWRRSRASWRAVLMYWCRSGRDESVEKEGWVGIEVKGWGWSCIRDIMGIMRRMRMCVGG
jgi:hypothetical protein